MSGGRSFQSLMVLTKKLCFHWSPVDPILTNLLQVLGWYCRVVLVGFCKYGGNGMATFLWIILWKTSRRDVLRLSWSAWSSSSCRIDVIIPGSLDYSCLINRAALLCAISIWYMCFCRCGSHTLLHLVYPVLPVSLDSLVAPLVFLKVE